MSDAKYLFWILTASSLVLNTYGTVQDNQDTMNGKGDRPNIIFILLDDLGYNDIGYNNPDVVTPTLDKMARSGRIFTQSHFQSLCTPSRGALMTGIYPFKTGMEGHVYQAPQAICAPSNLKLLPEALKESGYKTHLIGKWHLGYCKVQCTPTYRGFDTFYGHYLGGNDHFNHTDIEGYGFFDWRDGLDVDRSVIGQYSTHLVIDRAIRIIDSHNTTDEPFFMMLSFPAPHLPNQVPDNYLKFYPDVENEMLRTYYAMITAVDVGISKLYDKLVGLDMMDNTLIVLSSDNGGEGLAKTSDNTPFRGAKGSLWEGGTRVVTFAYGSMLTNTGQEHDGLIHAVDWYPTLLKIAEINTDGLYLDGLEQTEMVLNGKQSQRSELVYDISTASTSISGNAAIRVGDYKLIWGYPGYIDGWGREDCYFTCDRSQTHASRVDDPFVASTHSYTSMLFPHLACQLNATTHITIDPADLHSGATYLFNIKDDPEEKHDLAELPDYAGKILDMKKRISKMAVSIQKPQHVPFRLKQAVDADGNWSPGWCDDLDFTVEISSGSNDRCCSVTFAFSLIAWAILTYVENAA